MASRRYLQISKIIHIAVPIAITAISLLSTLLIVHLLKNETIPLWKISKNEMINFTFTMQIMVLVNSFIVLGVMYLYKKQNFKVFFRVGMFSSGRVNDWSFYGPVIAIAFTLGTILMVSNNVVSQHGAFNRSFFTLLPLVLLFSATNAWSEEIFSRFVIAVGLYGKIKPLTICSISGIMFGLAHFWGTPSGIFGVIVSGSLGWLLAKSVVETKGMGWALLIHFLQDIVIFGSGAMILAGSAMK